MTCNSVLGVPLSTVLTIAYTSRERGVSVAYRGGFGGFKPPQNSEDIAGVHDHMSKNRRLDFLL